MFDAARNDDELPFLDGHAPVPQLHREPALVNQEEFVLVLVPVPDKRALELYELHLMPVEFTNDLRLPMRSEEGELLRQVDLLHSSSDASLQSWGAEARTRATRR